MNTIEDSLNKIAENILHLDEASLIALWDKYKAKMEIFSTSVEWEKSVIIFSIINSVRVKNAIFNEQLMKGGASPAGGGRILQRGKTKPATPATKNKPNLKLVK